MIIDPEKKESLYANERNDRAKIFPMQLYVKSPRLAALER